MSMTKTSDYDGNNCTTTSSNSQIRFQTPYESVQLPKKKKNCSTTLNSLNNLISNTNSKMSSNDTTTNGSCMRDDLNNVLIHDKSKDVRQSSFPRRNICYHNNRNDFSSTVGGRRCKRNFNCDDNPPNTTALCCRIQSSNISISLSQHRSFPVPQNQSRRCQPRSVTKTTLNNTFSTFTNALLCLLCSSILSIMSINGYAFVTIPLDRKSTISSSLITTFQKKSFDNNILPKGTQTSLCFQHGLRQIRICTWLSSDRKGNSNNSDDVVMFDDEYDDDNDQDDEGVVADANNDDDSTEWRAILASLTMYKAAYGDLKVPQRFIVPNLAPWPEPAWGLKLGKVVSNIRTTGKYIDNINGGLSSSSSSQQNQQTSQQRKQQLDRLGFVWSVRRNNNSDSEVNGIVTLEQIVVAASTYRKLFIQKTDARSVIDILPDNYAVPDSEPWPESVRGLPLGRQLELLDQQCPPQVRAKLEELKILSEERTDEITSTTMGSDIPENDDDSYTSTSFSASANDIRFEKVYLALKTYKELYGDLLVPQPFTVPNKSKEWPEDTWGLRLGARVNAIRSQGTFVNSNPERRQILEDIGFAWSPPKEQRGRRGRKPKGGEEDNMKLDDEQQQDDDSSSDDELRNANNIKSRYSSEDSIAVESVGDDEDAIAIDSFFDGSFDFGSSPGQATSAWDIDNRQATSFITERDTAGAMKAAVAAKGDSDEYAPPRSFAESLAEATQAAIDVGVIEGMTPAKRVIKGKREKDIPWFNDDFGEYFVFEDVVEALTTYKVMFGTFANMSDKFVVPAPQEMNGFINEYDDFDVFGEDYRNGGLDSYENDGPTTPQGTLDSENDRDGQGGEDWIAAKIKKLQQEASDNDENSAVAMLTEQQTQYMTTRSTISWGEHLAGMRLGSIVSRIRDGSLEVKHIPERKDQLDAIEFEWGDPKYFIDIPFEKAMCAMYAYYLIRGDMFVYEDFVMPDEDPWPQALAGYELGMAVKRLRQLQNFLEAYHPDKVSLLRMIDFVWFSDTVALPLDPNEKEMTPETLLLSAMGHPDYAKMIDIPMGLPDKIIADGPFMETDDDPKMWWRKWHNWDYVNDYWYQQGRRDNAYVLRRMGYPQMADEHEMKYGIGMFKQIDQTFDMLEKRDESGGINSKSLEEKKDVLEQLDYFRQELIGCTDVLPLERDKFIADIDTYILLIMKGIDFETIANADTAADDDPEKFINGDEAYYLGQRNGSQAPGSNDDDEDETTDGPQIEEIYEDEEMDLEDELGFGQR